MAHVKIFNVASDYEAAEALGAELTERGHWVVIDDKRKRKRIVSLHLYECIIVLWSSASVASERLCTVAREAHSLGLLLPVRVDSLRTDQIPSEFQKLNTLVIDDIDPIVDAIFSIRDNSLRWRRHLHSSPAVRSGRIGAAPTSAPRPTGRVGFGPGSSGRVGTAPSLSANRIDEAPRASPQESALAIEAGRLVHKIPNKMWLGEPEMLEVRVGREATPDLASGLLGRGAVTSEDLPIVETMAVSLHSESGAFEIQSQTETVQLLMRDHLEGTPFEQAIYGRWLWLVTPRKTGATHIFVRVSASLKDSRGIPTSITLPDREFRVSVAVHAGRATLQVLKRGIPAVGGAIGAALLGAITQDWWWPKLKALLQSSGWIG